jgi:hypothetical protein
LRGREYYRIYLDDGAAGISHIVNKNGNLVLCIPHQHHTGNLQKQGAKLTYAGFLHLKVDPESKNLLFVAIISSTRLTK